MSLGGQGWLCLKSALFQISTFQQMKETLLVVPNNGFNNKIKVFVTKPTHEGGKEGVKQEIERKLAVEERKQGHERNAQTKDQKVKKT